MRVKQCDYNNSKKGGKGAKSPGKVEYKTNISNTTCPDRGGGLRIEVEVGVVTIHISAVLLHIGRGIRPDIFYLLKVLLTLVSILSAKSSTASTFSSPYHIGLCLL